MTETPVDPRDLDNVHRAISRVMEEVQSVGKDGRNTQQNFNFRGIDAVVNAVGPALRKHGVIVTPQNCTAIYEPYETSKGVKMMSCRINVQYAVIGPNGTSFTIGALGEASDAGDKSTPKAMSVAYRTALLQLLCIPTDEPDPDSFTSDRGAGEAAPNPRAISAHAALTTIGSNREATAADRIKAIGEFKVEYADTLDFLIPTSKGMQTVEKVADSLATGVMADR